MHTAVVTRNIPTLPNHCLIAARPRCRQRNQIAADANPPFVVNKRTDQ